MFGVRGWLFGVVAAGAIAAAVLGASERQRSTAETNFNEAEASVGMKIAMLSQERALDEYIASGRERFLETYYRGKVELTRSLTDARELSSDDELELRAIADQQKAYARWSGLAVTAIAHRATGDAVGVELSRGEAIDDFLSANDRYEQRLLVNRHAEEHAAALLPVWLMLGLGGAFLVTASVAAQRRRSRRLRQVHRQTKQASFVEAIQFAEDEAEAHQLLTKHLENAIQGSSVLVLNRNNSVDRLEPSRTLDTDDPLVEPLQVAEPRACLAVRLSRRFNRGLDDEEAFTCGICGRLRGPSSCQPLLVGGEVIGSVLVSHAQHLSDQAEQQIQESVTQAAPVLANLRNLAIAESRAATDALTGLPNRRSVDDTLRRMLAQADRTVSPLSVALLDLDKFKQINDTYGHDRGDDALAAVAALLRNDLRASDFAGRSGGEEFVFFLPNTDRTGALRLAEKIRVNLHKLRVAGLDQPLTGSFGVATFPDDATTPEALMRVADRALYQAKRSGRDRVESVPQLGDTSPAALSTGSGGRGV